MKRLTPARGAATAAGLAVLLAGCGLDIRSADLFALTRTGQGTTLRLIVNDAGTVRCNRAKPRPISNARLIQARDLSDSLGQDATAKLSLPALPGTVFAYRISLQQGTVSFSDRDIKGHTELAKTELFAAQVAQEVCGLSG